MTNPAMASESIKLATDTNDLTALNAAIQKKEAAIEKETIGSIAQTARSEITWWTNTNAMTMSGTVLLFGLLALILATYVIRSGREWEGVLKIFGMVMVLVLTAFLIVAGYDDKQIAPAVGLLGTIAGYLLGKEVPKRDGGTTDSASKSA